MNTSYKCAGCKNPIPKREFLQCSMCKSRYDIECANISSKLFNQMERKDQWKCPECTSRRPKKGNVNTPVRSSAIVAEEEAEQTTSVYISPRDSSNEEHNITHRTKITKTPILSVPGLEAGNTPPSTSHLEDLKFYFRDLLHDEMDSVREAIDGLTNTIKAQNTRIEQLEARVAVLEKSSVAVQDPVAPKLENTILQIQADIVERDQALLCNDLELAGCPETANENCIHIVLAVAKKIGVDLDEKGLVNVERAGPARSTVEGGLVMRPRPLAVRLARRTLRDALLRAARIRRDLNTASLQLPGPIRPVYINERLTKHNRILFQRARTLARDSNYKYVWTRDGKVFARQAEGKTRHRLQNEADFLRVFGKAHV